jgi:tetratricopeptide (TPR) repeat protein
MITSVAHAAPPLDGRRAGELALAAKAAFDRGAFRDAAELLKQAYALKPSAALLYNLGRAYQQAGERASAVDAYQAYLASESHPADEGAVRKTVEQLLDENRREADLRARAEEEAKSKRDAELAAEEARRASRVAVENVRKSRGAIPWAIAGVGAAAVVAAAVFGGLALSQHSSAANDPVASSAQAKQDQAKSFAIVANVGFAAGGVIAIAGILWGIFDLRATRASRLHLTLGVTGANLAVRF